MKKTRFFDVQKFGEDAKVIHEVDFIVEPPTNHKYQIIFDEKIYNITSIIDEFPGHELGQTRNIHLTTSQVLLS